MKLPKRNQIIALAAMLMAAPASADLGTDAPEHTDAQATGDAETAENDSPNGDPKRSNDDATSDEIESGEAESADAISDEAEAADTESADAATDNTSSDLSDAPNKEPEPTADENAEEGTEATLPDRVIETGSAQDDRGDAQTATPEPQEDRSENIDVASSDDGEGRSNLRSGIRGRITEVDTGGPLRGVLVAVYEGGSGAAFTDDDGHFELPLSPGAYVIRVVSEIHRSKRARVVVLKGRYSSMDVGLKFIESSIEVVTVEARMEAGNEATMLEVRRKATTLSDSMSAQEISRSGDSSAAGALKRVVSATVIDGKYVMVRGLGGRYMSTLLNGVPLPSPEPDRRAVPLDLFPTSLLANLKVAKSYSVTAPGTFAGGTVMIETNAYPSEFTLKAKVKTNGATNTTGETFLANSGGSFDFFGFDDGGRSLPGGVPKDHALRVGEGDLRAGEVEEIAKSFSNNWTGSERTAYPNLSLGLSVGDTIKVGGRKLGYLATSSFSHGFDADNITSAKVRNSGDTLEYREQMDTVVGKESATLGSLLNVGYELGDGHDIGAFGLYTHTGATSATLSTGVSESDGEEISSSRLKFVERSLAFAQLAGRHRLADTGLLRWQGNVSRTMRDEPDTRDITYNLLADGRSRYKSEPGSGERFFSDLEEQSFGGGVHGEAELGPVMTRVGATAQRSSRNFSARRFRMEFIGTDPSALFQDAENIFAPEMIGTAFRLSERTLATDAYTASNLVAGGYAESEVAPHEKLRLIGGVRFETSAQEMTPGSPFGLGETTESDVVSRRDNSFLPAAAAVFAVSDEMNLRSAYSYTLARPHFRELAPFLYFDYARRRSVSGNPGLTETRIHNADLRWEWFASETEVLAASAFYKKFADPIEQVIVSASGGDVSFANAESATSIGGELEARVGLGRLARSLSPLRAQANLSLIRSRVALSQEQLMSQTSSTRPLQGQSPYVVNLGLGYGNEDLGLDVNVLYNVFGRRIAEVGFDSLPDVYEQPQHRLDLSASKVLGRGFNLRLAGKNLLGQKRILDQGGLEVFANQPGIQVSAGLEWTAQ